MDAEKLTKLLQLQIKEVSGVDQPANELDGWMVMKAKGAPSSVQEALASASAAPEAVIVRKALERVIAKATYNDSLAELEQTDFAALDDFELRAVDAVAPDVLTKAKHDLRHAGTGRFIPLRGEIHGVPAAATSKSAIQWTHLGKPLAGFTS